MMLVKAQKYEGTAEWVIFVNIIMTFLSCNEWVMGELNSLQKTEHMDFCGASLGDHTFSISCFQATWVISVRSWKSFPSYLFLTLWYFPLNFKLKAFMKRQRMHFFVCLKATFPIRLPHLIQPESVPGHSPKALKHRRTLSVKST